MIMRLCLLVLLTALVALPLRAGFAQSEGIAVVVNDEIISFSDVRDRVNLIIASSGLPDGADTREKLTPQIVNSLIEEALQFQEAERLGLSVPDSEVDKAFASIAESNGAPIDAFRDAMVGRGISLDSLYRQLRAGIIWRRVFSVSLLPEMNVTDFDVDSFVQRLERDAGKTEYLLSEIFLPVDGADDEAAARDLARKVVADIRAKRVPFASVAQQISRAPGASRGGLLGWVQSGQLDGVLAQAVKDMDVKTTADPVRSLDGYHIFYLSEKREIDAESIPSSEKIRDLIVAERADRISSNRLNELRSEAFIEYRF